MGQAATTGLTYGDLQAFPADSKRRELLDGQLVVTPAPGIRHQLVVVELVTDLNLWARGHGGRVIAGPVDLLISPRDVVEPDLVYVAEQHAASIGDRFLSGPPNLVAEVTSPRRDSVT